MGILKQVCHNVLTPGSGPYSSGWPGFGNNLLQSGEEASKVSIEAPPGAIVQLNNETIIIGASGLYDFSNDDISITSIVFPQPKTYSRGAVDQNKKAQLEGFLRDIQENMEPLVENPLVTTANYKTFCLNGMAAITDCTYQYGNRTLRGFQEVLTEYLSIIQGELISTNKDLDNVIVNYISI